MTTHDYLRECTTNFRLDLEAKTIETPWRSELTMSGCGWDEGHQWRYRFPAGELLDEIDRCLAHQLDRSRITLAGVKFDYPLELDGGIGGPDWDHCETTPATAEFEIDLAKKQITFIAPD